MQTFDLGLTLAERRVLAIFRRFLMTAGEMLCFCSKELAEHRRTLDRLTEKGLIIAESRNDAYSLTRAGWQAMRPAHNRRGEGPSK